jgi:hypothetical protein
MLERERFGLKIDMSRNGFEYKRSGWRSRIREGVLVGFGKARCDEARVRLVGKDC